MFDRIKKLFGKTEVVEPEPPKSTKPKHKVKTKIKTLKDIATENGEPYIDIIKVTVDPNDINSGAFELDWNDKFITNLIKQGYQKKPNEDESVVVDRWFQTVCRNIALELYEQDQADPTKRVSGEMRVVQQRDLGNGRTEVS